ncbi:MAG TPA: hypothetical protein VJB94_00515 [Candidatus Nanoarchaeia archaeon]|nr:hypothetical protein [Candidatus Nanoarchaeia archaeon]
MNNILTIKDPINKIVYLSHERWLHIIIEHPELTNRIQDIESTVTNPNFTRESKRDKKVLYYYKYNKMQAKYLLVAVKYLNGKGFIITAFNVRKIK